jgi:hypothetical protein
MSISQLLSLTIAIKVMEKRARIVADRANLRPENRVRARPNNNLSAQQRH